jgi:23S rRNA (cytosine1962-C5)-methyltransferase
VSSDLSQSSIRIDDVLAAAARRRTMPIPSGTDVLRLVDDEGDGCPGLVVDRYGPVLRFEARGPRWPSSFHGMALALCAHERAPHAVGLLRTSAGKSVCQSLVGDAPRAHIVTEAGVRLLVRTVDDEAAGAGVFVDHRAGRAAVRARARGGAVLNLFAHAGAFGAFAVAGGAARVDHVDAAKKSAPWAALNIALAGADPRKHRFLVDDALVVVARFANKGPAYDVVVCDPPTTAVRPDGTRFHVDKHLAVLARDCVRCLRPRGVLLLSTNHRALSVRDVQDAAHAGASDAGRSMESVQEIALPPDITTANDARLRPMRGVIAVVI